MVFMQVICRRILLFQLDDASRCPYVHAYSGPRVWQVVDCSPQEQPKRKRTFRKFSYRGVDLENLFDLTNDQLLDLLNARQRRRLGKRGLKRKHIQYMKKLRKAVRGAPCNGVGKMPCSRCNREAQGGGRKEREGKGGRRGEIGRARDEGEEWAKAQDPERRERIGCGWSGRGFRQRDGWHVSSCIRRARC